jgi:hypothetical protein
VPIVPANPAVRHASQSPPNRRRKLGRGNTKARNNEPSRIDRRLMLDHVERSVDVVKAKALTAGVVDQAVYRLDRPHSDTDSRQR